MKKGVIYPGTVNLADNRLKMSTPAAGLNHLFQTAETGLFLEYSDWEETFCIQALKDIADWIMAK